MNVYVHDAVVTAALLVAFLPVAALLGLAVTYRRYGRLAGWPLVNAVGLIGSASSLAGFTVFPLPDESSLECTGGPLVDYWQTTPFTFWHTLNAVADESTVAQFLASSEFKQVFFNVLLFVPLGFFLHQVTRWRAPWTMLACAGTSLLVELTQGTGVWGIYDCPYRLFDVDDLIINTTGGVIGVALAMLVTRHWGVAQPAASADLEPPRLRRRAFAVAVDVFLVINVNFILQLATSGSIAAVAALRGVEMAEREWWVAPVSQALAVATVALVVPWLRGDRATPGQVAMNLVTVRDDHGAVAATRADIGRRFVARWTVWALLPWGAALLVLVMEFVAARVGSDKRSWTAQLSRTAVVTEPAFEAARAGEQPLAGGNVTDGVARVGRTVRRPVAPQTATVHRLLRHAIAQGVDWVPTPRGLDPQGREVIDYVPGEVAHGEPSYLRQEHVLKEVATAARQWHDATASFERGDHDVWQATDDTGPVQVISHGDFAPYNHVFRDGHFAGAIDFDTCAPGSRLWDLAWTAYRYVPLNPPTDADVPDGPGADRSPFTWDDAIARLTVFLNAYGDVDRENERDTPYAADELLELLPRRLDAIAAWAGAQDSEDQHRWGAMYAAHAEWIRGLTPEASPPGPPPST